MHRGKAISASDRRGGARPSADVARVALMSRLLRTPKRGEKESDDAGCSDDQRRIYALCDGATRSFLPGEWAQILANHVCEKGLPPIETELRMWLEPARQRWERERQRRLEQVGDQASSASWWMNTPGRGAAATLFAITFSEESRDGEIEYRSVMRGDTCGFHVRNGQLIRAMPFGDIESFSMHPDCLMSIGEGKEPVLKHVRDAARPGDLFFVATDALAKWILTRHHAKSDPWSTLLELDTEDQLREFADHERAAERPERGRMEEDDVSLLVIKLSGADEPRRPLGEDAHDARRQSRGGGNAPTDRHDKTASSARGDAWSTARPGGAATEDGRSGEEPRATGRQGSVEPTEPRTMAHARPEGPSVAERGGRHREEPMREHDLDRPAALVPAPRYGAQRVSPTMHDPTLASNSWFADAATEPAPERPREAWLRGKVIWSVLVPAVVSMIVSSLWSFVLMPSRDNATDATNRPPSPKPGDSSPMPSASVLASSSASSNTSPVPTGSASGAPEKNKKGGDDAMAKAAAKAPIKPVPKAGPKTQSDDPYTYQTPIVVKK